MPEVKKHRHGEPSWAQLATSDDKGALKFYSGLFGWKDDPSPMGPGAAMYHTQMLGKLNAVGLYQMDDREKGMPPHWEVYFAVTNADETAKKVKAAGGTVVMEPFDVMDHGRMLVAQDPSGAFVSFWQAKKHVGFTIQNEPGAIVWFELAARGVKKAIPFYKTVLGIETSEMTQPGMVYNIFHVGGTNNSGMAGAMEMPKEVPAQVPSNWTPYFAVANCDASAKKVTSLGGKVIFGPQDIPNVGRFATIADPQGAVFAILQPAPV